MNWGAHKADVRIAAKNSVTMRAALRASINAQAIYAAYQSTQPYASDNITQDRARARAWAMLHVKINTEPIEGALKKIYTDGFLLGLDASKEAIGQAKKEANKAAITKADDSDYVDWNKWTPGNRAAALLFRPTGAFQKILNDAGITSKTIAKAGYDRIGTALADSVAAGFSPARAAKVITEKIGDPARALTIAITEQNRAMSLAAMENYKNYGVEKIEWSGANPCDICAENEGQVVITGEPFRNGDTEPPSHPNCRCAIMPVIGDMEDDLSRGQDFLDILGGASVTEESYPDSLSVDEAAKVIERFNAANPDFRLTEASGDKLLGALQDAMGYNRLPKLVSLSEMNDLEEQGWTRVYRGLKDTDNVPAQNMIQQFKTGQHYPGFGMYGNGTYTSTWQDTAIRYAAHEWRNVMEMAIAPDAKVAKVSQLVKMMDEEYGKEIKARGSGFAKSPALAPFQDVGRYAVMKGYDAIEVPQYNEKNEKYYVVLNRTKVAVRDDS